MVVLAIEWRISQHLEQTDTMNWDQISKGMCEVYINGMFWF